MFYSSQHIVIDLVLSELLICSTGCELSLQFKQERNWGNQGYGLWKRSSRFNWRIWKCYPKCSCILCRDNNSWGIHFRETLGIVECLNEQMSGWEALGCFNEVLVFSALDLFCAFHPWWWGSNVNNQWKAWWMSLFCSPHSSLLFSRASFINPVTLCMCPRLSFFYWAGSMLDSGYLVIRSVILSQAHSTFLV